MGFYFISTLLNSGYYYCTDLFPNLPYCFTFQLNLLSEKSFYFFLESFPTCIQRKCQFHLILSHYKSFPLYEFSYNASFLVDCSILCSQLPMKLLTHPRMMRGQTSLPFANRRFVLAQCS